MPYTPYLNLTQFRARTLMPQVDITAVETETPGFTLSRLTTWSAKIDTRLRKRYAVPFTAPVPEAVLEWLTKIVTYELYLKRGVDPSDQTLALIHADKENAEAEIKEAANAQDGLFDLPVNDTQDAEAASKAAGLMYTEASPYTWTDIQRAAGRSEDQSGGGDH